MSTTTTVTPVVASPPNVDTISTKWGPIVVSVVTMVVFLAAIVVAWLTKDSSLPVLLGMAGTNAGTAVGYWLGSSAGSKAKDAKIGVSPTP